jgi:hypothetical protein
MDILVRFQVLTAASMRMTVFWDVAQGSLIDVLEVLAASISASIIALMMMAASTFETSVNFYQTTQRNIPEDSHPQRISDLSRYFLFLQ